MNILKKFFDKAYKEEVKDIIEEIKENQFIPEPPKKVKRNRFDLKIYLKDGSDFGYNIIADIKSISCIALFYDFYKWFYEKSSPYYTYEHRQGADIFVRSEIRNITMRRKEIEEEVKE